MRKPKSETVHNHFKRRCYERVGMLLDEEQLVQDIQNKKLKFLEKQSNRVSIYSLNINEKEYRLAYDKHRHQCITIMPEHFFDPDVSKVYLALHKDEDKISAIKNAMHQYNMTWEQACIFLESL